MGGRDGGRGRARMLYSAFRPTEDFPMPADENRRLNREARINVL